jgi:transposase InsO family protein
VVAWARRHGVAAAVSKYGVSDPSVRSWLEQDGGSGQADKAKGKRNRARKERTKPSPQQRAQSTQTSSVRNARHGRRFSPAEKQEILQAAAGGGVSQAAADFNVSRWSIYEWQRRQKRAKTTKEAEQALLPRSSRPKRNGRQLSEQRYELIAETWKRNQALGPRQVRNQLRRTHGLRVGTSTVRRVMEEQGYVPPKVTVERRVALRYEAVRPNQQVHLDFLHFYVHKAKAYLLLIEDDYSRFIVGWALCEGERAEPVIESVDAAIARHGKPEQMVVDGGSGFFSWRGQSRLERVCGDYGIDFIKASKKGSNSKLEALNANVRKELLSRVEFADLADARTQIARWVYSYNFERVHEGLGGLLVPADRYLGRTEQVLAQLERGEAVVVPGAEPVQGRTLEMFRVLSRGGQPELWLLGQQIWPPTPPR